MYCSVKYKNLNLLKALIIQYENNNLTSPLTKTCLEDHSTRLLLLLLNSFEMEDFLLLLAFFTPIHQNKSQINTMHSNLKMMCKTRIFHVILTEIFHHFVQLLILLHFSEIYQKYNTINHIKLLHNQCYSSFLVCPVM